MCSWSPCSAGRACSPPRCCSGSPIPGSSQWARSRFFWCCYQHRLPMPVPQYEVRDGPGVVSSRASTSLGRRSSVFIEFDGRVKYEKLLKPGQRASDVVVAEKQREEAICRVTGWRCLRITWADLADPVRLAARIREFLYRRHLIDRRTVAHGPSRARLRRDSPPRPDLVWPLLHLSAPIQRPRRPSIPGYAGMLATAPARRRTRRRCRGGRGSRRRGRRRRGGRRGRGRGRGSGRRRRGRTGPRGRRR